FTAPPWDRGETSDATLPPLLIVLPPLFPTHPSFFLYPAATPTPSALSLHDALPILPVKLPPVTPSVPAPLFSNVLLPTRLPVTVNVPAFVIVPLIWPAAFTVPVLVLARPPLTMLVAVLVFSVPALDSGERSDVSVPA